MLLFWLLSSPWAGCRARGRRIADREANRLGRLILMTPHLAKLWTSDQGQDIAEYAVMLAVILVIVVGTIRLIGSNANTVFSQAASSIQ
jgi:Flp pilus assembly pilin Flp